MTLNELIKKITKQVFADCGKTCEPISVERTALADTQNGVSGDSDKAGEWLIQCGTDRPLVLTLTNEQTKDPATRERHITAAIRDLVK